MKRKIAAIMAADVAGYSRLVAADEDDALARLIEMRGVFARAVDGAEGRIFNTAGDAILAEFPSAVEAVRAAIDIQSELARRNGPLPVGRRMLFRIGLTIGDVIERDGDLLGDGVNIAARLQTLAPAGGLCLSRTMHEQVAGKIRESFRDLGSHQVKNMPQAVHAFVLDPPAIPEPPKPPARETLAVREPDLRAEPRHGRAQPRTDTTAAPRRGLRAISLGVLGLAILVLAFQLGPIFLSERPEPVLAELATPPTIPAARDPAPPVPAPRPSQAHSQPPAANREPALRPALPAAGSPAATTLSPATRGNGSAAPSQPEAAPRIVPEVPASNLSAPSLPAPSLPAPSLPAPNLPTQTSDAEPPALPILPPQAPVVAAVPPLSAVPPAGSLLPPAPVPEPVAAPFRAEAVPFICDECRRRIGSEFARGRGYKALAVEPLGAAGWVTGEASAEAAQDKALAQCRQQSRGRECFLYATQDGVVRGQGEPPLPPSPWIRREGTEPFDAERLVQLAPQARERVARLFAVPQATRVLALGPRGEWAAITDSLIVEEAARRALEACGHFANAPCRVVAVDQSFVDAP
jgi:adenylate cyclase